jgi:glutathione S-transferase
MPTMIKLFGHPMSTCTRKVLFTLHETNTPYELTTVDFAKGEHKGAAHLARQPWGKLPALEDNGFELFESRAMARYVDLKAGGKLTPKDPQQHGLMEQWISVETSYFYGPAMTFIYNDVFKRAQPQEELDKATAALDFTAGILDKHLAKHTWLAGDQLSIAEVAFAPYIEYAMMSGAKATLVKHPHFSAWWNRVSERPAWQKTAGR